MKLPRRTFMHLAAGAAALLAVSRIASALDYPSRPVRWIALAKLELSTVERLALSCADEDALRRLQGQALARPGPT